MNDALPGSPAPVVLRPAFGATKPDPLDRDPGAADFKLAERP